MESDERDEDVREDRTAEAAQEAIASICRAESASTPSITETEIAVTMPELKLQQDSASVTVVVSMEALSASTTFSTHEFGPIVTHSVILHLVSAGKDPIELHLR